MQFAVEDAVGTVFTGRDDELMSIRFEVLAQAEFAGNAAEQRAGFEVDALRRGQGLTIGVAVDLRQVVASVGLGVAGNGIVIQHANDLGHGLSINERQRRAALPTMMEAALLAGQSFGVMG